jgi:uncharacterized membrane protein YozB (DUF420 family)
MMVDLRSYYLWFFLWCLVLTCICGVLAALLPRGLGGALTAVPYLVAMITMLHRFLKRERRAPTAQEQKRITLNFSLIFWGYNLSFLLFGLWWFSRQDPEIFQNFMLYASNSAFLLTVLMMFLLLAIPLYLITYWFYGKQAQRMAQKMFNV